MYLLISVVFGIALISLTVYPLFLPDNKKMELRKRQSQNIIEENRLRYNVNKLIEKRIKYTKREQLELFLKQAGLKTTLADYYLFSFMVAVFASFVGAFLFNNMFLGILFFVVGFFTPKQLISFMRNNRLNEIEKQIGSFLTIVIERFYTTQNLKESLSLALVEFEGVQPIENELRYVISLLNSGYSMENALAEFSKRTENQFIRLFEDAYNVSIGIGTNEAMEANLKQVLIQFKENRKGKHDLRSRIQAPKRDSLIMLMTVPAIAVYQVATNPDYVPFMTQTMTGKIGTGVIIASFFGCLWFINNKIGAPID